MTYFNTRRRGRRVAVLLSVWLASGCWTTAPAWGGHKGNAQYKQARKAELSGDLDKAYELYQAALKAEPEDQTYMLAVRRVRFLDGQSHVDKGHKLADQGKLAEAALEFEKALTIDPSLAIAAEDLRRTQELIARSKEKKKPGTAEAVTKAAEPTGLSPLLAAKKETEQLLEEAQPVPTLRPISTQRINLKASNNSKVIFETIGKLAGINVLFDPEMQGRRVTIELNNATLHESLEYTAAIAKAFWKPLSSNAIFITDDNTQKRREYEDYVVKTFYLTNAYTAQELQEIATAVRSVTEIRRVYTVNSLNALVIRGTTDQVALAEKIIDDVDKSRAEVIVDVLVLETSHTKTREFGLVPVSGGTPGIDVPIGINPLNPAAGSTGTPTTTPSTTPTTTPTTTPITTPSTTPSTPSTGAGGSYVFGKTNILNFAMNIPNAELKALLSTSNTRVLQSPRIRGFDGYKAQLRIGSRIPIATGSFQPGIGGVGINPLVNTQFNYQDVGVVMDMLPRVHYGKEVSMHVELEISNVVDHVDIGGISQPVIGQRKIIHDIRLKEGEASIIGGLNQTQTSKTLTGIPGLSQIPLLGHLFSNQKLDISDSEILLVLIPHVVRVPDITDLNLRAVSAGSDTTVKLNFAEPDDDSPALPPVSPAPGPLPPSAAVPGAPAPAPIAASPAPSAPPPAVPAPATPAPAAVTPPAAIAAPRPAAPAPVPAARPPAVPARAGAMRGAPAAGAGPVQAPAAPPKPIVPEPKTEAPTTLRAPNQAENLVPHLRFDRTAATAATGSRIILNLYADNVTDLFATPLRITYNSKVLHLAEARKGAVLSSDGQDIIFSKNIQDDAGEASIHLSRFPGSGGVSGSGVLLTLEFQAAAPGQTSVSVANVAARNSKLETIPLGAAQADVTVK